MEDWGAVKARLEGVDNPPLRADIRAALDRVEQKTKDEQEWYESFHRMMGERDALRQRVEELTRERAEAAEAEAEAQRWQTEASEAEFAARAAEAKLAEARADLAGAVSPHVELAQSQINLREALDFLRRCDTKDEIVSTGRLTALQIANACAAGTMYVEPGGGRGWVVRPSGPAPAWVGQQEAQERIAELSARHLKHPTGDYCVYCRSQWPCEESGEE